VFAGLALLTSFCYLTIRSRYLPHGQGFRLPAANLIYPVDTPSALAPIWSQSDFSECFYAKADGLGNMQFEVYSYIEHPRPHPVFWTLEDLDSSGGPAVVRNGSFPATDMHDYGFIRLGFDPIPQSAGKLYRLTLKSPDTNFRESGAVLLYRTGDTEAMAAQQAGGAPRPAFSVLFDQTHEHEFMNVFFRHGASVSQVFTPRQEFMTSLQIQMTVGGLPSDYKIHWNVVRLEDNALIGSGDVTAASVEDWQFVDLFLTEREKCFGRDYRVTLGADEGGGSDRGAIGLPVFFLNGSAVTISSRNEPGIKPGFTQGHSANLIIMDSRSMRGLRLFYRTGSELPPDEYFSSNMTLWYFPSSPLK
jgi:hypothetical protein